MSGKADLAARRPLPRWRYTSRATLTAEFGGDAFRTPRAKMNVAAHDAALHDFHRTPSFATALEVVHTAVAHDRGADARRAAEFLRGSPDRLAAELASTLDALSSPSGHRARVLRDVGQPPGSSLAEAATMVARYRARLEFDPHSAFGWLDLARAFTVLGQTRKAGRAMTTALALAPSHRIVLRTYARWLVHRDATDEALSFVREHPRTRTDPWLMSVEITLATMLDTAPRFAVRGRKMTEQFRDAPAFVTELCSSIATLDHEAGDHRRARKLYRLSLDQPTDNSVAQAQFAARSDPALAVPTGLLELPETVEARHWRALSTRAWLTALEEAEAWLKDEPFSSRAAVNGSYIAMMLESDFPRAVAIARAGLSAAPDDHLLRNNLVVALVYDGNVLEAASHFALLRPDVQATYPGYVYRATQGLLAFASGHLAEGRRFYDDAEQLAPKADRARIACHRFEAESMSDPDATNLLLPALLSRRVELSEPMIVDAFDRAVDRHRLRAEATTRNRDLDLRITLAASGTTASVYVDRPLLASSSSLSRSSTLDLPQLSSPAGTSGRKRS